MNKVYKGKDKNSGEQVIVKMYSTDSTAKMDEYINDLTITELMSGKEHFPKLLDSYVNNSTGYLITNSYSMSLVELIKYSLSEKVLKNICYQICCALRTLHNHGIVYSSLNFDNILLDKNGKIILNGFNNSILLEKQNMKGNKQYPTDVWNLGVLLHFMITGKHPITHIDKVTNRNYLDFTLLRNTSVSTELKHLIWSLLQTKPEKRISTLLEVLQHPWLNNDLPQ